MVCNFLYAKVKTCHMKITFQEAEQKGFMFSNKCFRNLAENSAPTPWTGIYSPWASPLNLLAFSVRYRGKHVPSFSPQKKNLLASLFLLYLRIKVTEGFWSDVSPVYFIDSPIWVVFFLFLIGKLEGIHCKTDTCKRIRKYQRRFHEILRGMLINPNRPERDPGKSLRCRWTIDKNKCLGNKGISLQVILNKYQ